MWYWTVLAGFAFLAVGMLLGSMRGMRGGRSKSARSTQGPATRQSTVAGAPATRAPRQASTGAEPTAETQQRLLERLRESNLDLTARLRAATDAHAREMLDRSQAQQTDQQRHERQLEELRQTHAAELSHLMQVMVEQVDGMQRDHANHVRALEAEIERLRHSTAGGDGDPSNALTRPITVISGGDMQPPPRRSTTRPGA